MFVNEFFNISVYLYRKKNMPKKLTKEIFIEKARQKHANEYDYSLVNYINNATKIDIICPKHGVFEQTPNNHLFGKRCHKCAISHVAKLTTSNKDVFIKKAIKVHGDKYDYSLVDYINSHTKVNILCKEHGMFRLNPNCHLTGGGCPRCVGRGKTTDDFINESRIKHGNKYDYSLCEYIGTHKKINILCPKHGIFKQSPNQHLNGGGCPTCNDSKGERDIRVFLVKNNILFIPQKRFKDCRDKRPLAFDFYLPTLNTCIEFQGIQHFKPVNYFGGINVYNLQRNRDLIKTSYCKNKKINLIFIRYDEDICNKLTQQIVND